MKIIDIHQHGTKYHIHCDCGNFFFHTINEGTIVKCPICYNTARLQDLQKQLDETFSKL